MIGNIPANNLSGGDVLSEYVGITGPEYEIGKNLNNNKLSFASKVNEKYTYREC